MMQRSLPMHGDPPKASPRRFAISAKGFRPFFLLAAVFGSALIPFWILVLAGFAKPVGYLAPFVWHAHEMIFGYTVAVIAGFLLTAVGNWTQRETLVGGPLIALAGLWVLGRFVMAFAGVLPRGVPAVVDLAFMPALVAALGRPLVQARNRRNFVVLAVLGGLFAANLVVHLDGLGVAFPGSGRQACLVAIDGVVVLILIIAGRVFPMFTRNATEAATIHSSRWLELTTVGGMVLLTAIDIVAPSWIGATALSGVVGSAALARAWGWRARGMARQPLLWVLHLGHAWVPIGLLLRVVARFTSAVPMSLATHALTVGALGSLTLGMMARVSLGHTGRPLVVARPIAWAFASIAAAAFARVLAPLVLPAGYFVELVVAGTLWTTALLVYLAGYARMLWRPRADLKAG
jgi:uncharacterized protein involved in response to NO